MYVHLCTGGPSKAGDVAVALKLQRTETYRTLERLVQRGFVAPTPERPSRFAAAPVEEVFARALAAEDARSRTAQAAQVDIGPALRSLRPPAPPAEGPRNTFKTIQGRRDAVGSLERLLRSAEREVLWLDTHPSALAVAKAAGLWDLAARRAREGVRVRAVLRAGPEAAALAARGGATLEVRAADAQAGLRLAVADGREVLVWLASDEGPSLTAAHEAAVWSDAPDFVRTEEALFDALWRATRPAAEAIGGAGHAERPPAR